MIDYQEDIPEELIFRIPDKILFKGLKRTNNVSNFFDKCTHQNCPSSIFDEYVWLNHADLSPFDELYALRNARPDKATYAKDKIRYSKLQFLSFCYRNNGLRFVTNTMHNKYGLKIVPVYLTSENYFEDNNNFNKQINEKNSFSNTNPFVISMELIPEILEQELDWKQVLEIKKDKRSNKKLQRFYT